MSPCRVFANVCLGFAVIFCAFMLGWRVAHQPEPFRDDMDREIVIPRDIPGDWRICDGANGACFPLENLREASAAMRRQ